MTDLERKPWIQVVILRVEAGKLLMEADKLMNQATELLEKADELLHKERISEETPKASSSTCSFCGEPDLVYCYRCWEKVL